jgi:class 3 adenylate cyclase/tetratricopeptide (TPR) repeat protein
VLVCNYCHHENAPESRFCGQCGARLVAPTLRRDERKVISVLFVDLVGFTSRAEHMDVEDVQAMLDPYYSLVAEQLEQCGGTVEKFIGDAVVALFGVPVAHEDDPERAVRAALAIRDALGALNAREPTLDLHVRIAVTTGEALVAVDISPVTGETFASGDVVNTAARLQAAAPVDGIVVGEATYRSTRYAIEYADAPPVAARGKTTPVQCWVAVRARSRVGESRHRQDATPLIDRSAESRALVDALERVRSSPGVQSLTLVGDPGIGKSRLVRELARHIDRRPELVRWREGRSPPYGHGVTFWALGEIVKAEAGMLETHELAAASVKLAEAVAGVIDDADEAVWVERHLRALVGLETGGGPLGDHRAEAFAAWRRFIERLAERRVTVLVFEDLHWADDALVDFIEHLLAWAAGIPLLVLCTARPELLERRPAWGRDDGRNRLLRLGPLSDPDADELLDALLGKRQLPPRTRAALLAGAEGNPLYAQEFVRMLDDRELLLQHGQDPGAVGADDVPAPDSVVGIIAARLDAVPAEDRLVMQGAAIIGRAFWPGAVSSVAERDRSSVDAALARLEQRQLVRRRHDSSVAGDIEYLFEHGLIRDVAYRSIVRPQRAEKHRRAAEWLSALTGDPRDRADMVAHHYLTALENARAARQPTTGLAAAALDALIAAAERAASLHSHAAAARLWRRALDLCPSGDGRRPRMLLAHGRALAFSDEPALLVLERAAGALLDAGDRTGAAEAESTMAWLDSVAGRPVAAYAHDERALELARDLPSTPVRALILSGAGADRLFLHGRRDEAAPLLREALSIADALGLREMQAEALQFLGLARLEAGDGAGVRDIETALAVATELNSPVSLSCYGNLADMRRYFGSLAESAALNEGGERAAGRFGVLVQLRRFRAGRGCDLYYQGDWDAALAEIDDYVDAIEAGASHRMAGETRLYRGRILMARGDQEGALADARAALEFARRTTAPFDLFSALAFLAGLTGGQPLWGAWALPDLVAALAGDRARQRALRRLLETAEPRTRWYDAACATLDGEFARAAELYAAMGSRPDEAMARLEAARRAVAAGDIAEGRRQLEPATAFFRQVDARVPLRAAATLADAAVATPAAGPSRRSAR